MAEITAQLNNFRQSPRKVRVVANLVRGKSANDAVITLQFADKRASLPISKLIASAVANAKAQSIDTDTLIVKRIEVNAGAVLKRRRPVAHGSAHPIHKRTSHIFVLLSTKTNTQLVATTNVVDPIPKQEKKVAKVKKVKAVKKS